jgi:hypothetical protein
MRRADRVLAVTGGAKGGGGGGGDDEGLFWDAGRPAGGDSGAGNTSAGGAAANKGPGQGSKGPSKTLSKAESGQLAKWCQARPVPQPLSLWCQARGATRAPCPSPPRPSRPRAPASNWGTGRAPGRPPCRFL